MTGIRVYLWTIAALYTISLLVYVREAYAPQAKSKTADEVRRSAVIGMLICVVFLAWVASLL